jgi:hypothetical protein
VAALSRRASRVPSSVFSAGVVRIRVVIGLCTYRFRSLNWSGTVSIGPKLTMSSAPTDTTCGIPALPAALSRSGPAEKMPPTSSSASSVVVASSTPASRPWAASDSSVRPPVPVMWNTSTS